MIRKIQIELVGKGLAISADLLDDVNRESCDVLWKSTPYQSPLLHTMVSGKNIHNVIPNVMPFWEHTPTVVRRMAAEPGTIFCPYPRCMFIKYGPDSEDHSFAPVARVVPGDLPKLEQMGRLCFESMYRTKETCEVRVIRVGEEDRAPEPMSARLFDPALFENAKIRRLVTDMNDEIEKIWLKAPEELLTLYSGRHSKKTAMGSYGQYFSTVFFVEGEVSRLSNIANIGAIDNLLRLCRQTDVDLPFLKIATKTLCEAAARYLAMCDQDKISSFFMRALESFDAIESREEYFRLFSTYALYTSRFHAWNLHMFPWQHGDKHVYGETSGLVG